MLARLDPAELGRVWFPLGEQDKAETRAEAERAGLDAAQRAESQEACFLAGDDYRAFLGRHGLAPRDGRDRGRAGPRARPARRLLALHAPASARASASSPSGRSTSSARTRPRTPSSSARARRSRARTSTASGRLYADVDRADVKLRYRSPAVAARVSTAPRGFELELDEPAYGVAAGQAAVLYEGDAVVGCGLVSSADAD